MNVITINSYAGSLIEGARRAGHLPTLSLEDTGFGSEMQSKNFPDVPHIPKVADWPAQDLSDTLVLAHPPCSAFSTMTPTAGDHKGVDCDAFKCTKQVLDYATQNDAHTIAIESVVGACDGARVVHEHYAKQSGYNLFRVFQDAKDFGCPQNRKRFWAIFSRFSTLAFETPQSFTVIRDIIGAPGEQEEASVRMIKQQFDLMEKCGLPAKKILHGSLGFGLIRNKIKKTPGAGIHPTRFAISTPYLLDPSGYAPTLLGGCHWYIPDNSDIGCRPLTTGEYNLIMGFPEVYKMYPERLRTTYLSKGVCPPVAEWIVRSIFEGGDRLLKPNGILDLT